MRQISEPVRPSADHLEKTTMNFRHLIFILALLAGGVAAAAEPPVGGAAKAQSAPLTRADVVAEIESAIASGELKFGPLIDYQTPFAPAPAAGPRHRTTRSRTARGHGNNRQLYELSIHKFCGTILA